MNFDQRRTEARKAARHLGDDELHTAVDALEQVKKRPSYRRMAPERLPTGPIPRYEFQTPHDELLSGHDCVDTVMIDTRRISRLLGDRSNLGEWLLTEEPDIITTTTFTDRALFDISWDDEAELVAKLEPALHSPCDYPVYPEMSLRGRLENIQDMIHGVYSLAEQLWHTDTRILPLVKGVSPFELRIFSQTLFSGDFPYFAFYAAQYYGNGIGNPLRYIQKDLYEAVDICDPDGVLLIGPQSPSTLSTLPSVVQSAAGLRIIQQSLDADDRYETYCDLSEKMSNALISNQKRLSEYSDREAAA